MNTGMTAATAEAAEPDNTAVRTALWRALHVEVDPPPHVFDDVVGAQLVGAPGWRRRGDMDPIRTSSARASIVARARLVEDLVIDSVGKISQYVILGAGLDTFAQRRPDLACQLTVFEVDQPGPQAWKRQRLTALGYDTPGWLRFVPVNFETSHSWWDQLIDAGFSVEHPAVVASMGVFMYLTTDANEAMLRQLAQMAPGSTAAITFQVPIELVDEPDRPARRASERGARRAGTPFVSFYCPRDILQLAADAGFNTIQHISATDLTQRYFTGRPDHLRPSTADQILLATTGRPF